MSNPFKLDLSKYINKNYTALVGRESGESIYEKIKNDKKELSVIEGKYSEIIILIPKRIITINKSFFLGFFETRVQELGKEAFIEKYNFETSDHIKKKIAKYIDTALLSASMKEIING